MIPIADPAPDAVAALAARLEAAAQTRLGRSLAIFAVSTGGCGGCEAELRALPRAPYGLARFGLSFVANPRQADVLLATGPLAANMQEALLQAYAATPEPKWVVSVGDCAVDGGVFKGSYAVRGGIGAVLAVDLLIRGCPPSPAEILTGLLALVLANDPGVKRRVAPALQ